MSNPIESPGIIFPVENQALADSLTLWRDGLPTTVLKEAYTLRYNHGLFSNIAEVGLICGSKELDGGNP